jgi:hypothetical protein
MDHPMVRLIKPPNRAAYFLMFFRAGRLQLRNHTEVTRRARSAYFRGWADIFSSNVHGWAPTCSIGFQRSRRRTRPVPIPPVPIPMCPSSASPAPGFISSTRKPENSSATSDAEIGSSARNPRPSTPGANMASAPSRTPPCVHFCTVPPERIPPQCVIASGATSSVTGNQIVPGKKYLTEQAATFLKFAMATTDPDVAAGFLVKAADLSARSEEAPDASPRPPDVEQPES